jgi:hypothetical protein
MNLGPIFIGGPDRCGKTTMRAFLVSHPHISIPAVGSNMWTFFYGQYGDLARRENFERCLKDMLHYKHVAFLRPDAERIRQEFWLGEPSYARLFALVQQHHAEQEGKPRWGDQSGLIECYADEIFSAYPDARLIHMIRDPRDRYEASLARWPTGKGRAGGAAARWLYSARLAMRNQRKYAGRYLIVHFEQMITRPEETLRQVCDFLEEEFTPAMLTMEGAPDHREKMLQNAQRNATHFPLSDEFIGRYRQAIPKEEIAFLQAQARREMAAFGYPPDEMDFSAKDRLAYAMVSYPLNLARMIGWTTIETVQHNFPGLLGRKPGAERFV